MAVKQMRDLDSAIETVLHAERMRPAPLGLRRRVESRVRYIALQQKTRRQFRSTVLTGVVLAGAVIFFGALGLWRSGILNDIAQGMPGLMGHLDRMTAPFPSSTLTVLGAAAGTFAGLLALLSLAGLLPGIAQRRTRHRG